MSEEVNTKNDFLFGSNGKEIGPLLPPVMNTRQQAFRTAAWISTMAMILPEETGQEGVSFEDIQKAVMNT